MQKETKSTILVVDDDQRVLNSTKTWLTSEGFNLLTASNESEALKSVISNPVEVALVDFRIGKEDGISVARRLRQADEDVKIIILTGFPSYETAVRAMKIGAFDYLSKASSNLKILSTIKKAIEERNKENTVKAHNSSLDRRIKLILFCNHSLIKERLENLSKKSLDFKLVKAFPSVDSFKIKNLEEEIYIALVCAGCNIKNFKDSYVVFPEIYRSFPGIKTLIINENFSDRQKVELLKLGVRGFFSQDSSSDKLEKALTLIAKGELWVSRNVTQLSLKDMVNYKPASTMNGRNISGLTLREIEILRNITSGLKNKEIADKLSISEPTVKTHVNRIFKKLGVDNRTKAILTAMERKII